MNKLTNESLNIHRSISKTSDKEIQIVLSVHMGLIVLSYEEFLKWWFNS